jgi:putative DNA primase/helicase
MRRSSAPTGDWRDGLAKTEAGTVRKNLFNACVALREHPELTGKITYDEFNGCTFVAGPLPWDTRSNRPWSEFDDLAATEWMQDSSVGILVGPTVVRDAVQRVAYENRFHPVLKYLEGLAWDGDERLSRWLTTYLGAPQSALTDAVGRKFLISAVARVVRPGCQADHMPILEGPQGTLKSTALRTLVGDDWFTDQISDLGTKDSCQDLRGKWIIELSELSAVRRSDVERVKAYVSRRVDHYRASYGRRSGDVPRQNVFCGSTNDAST